MDYTNKPGISVPKLPSRATIFGPMIPAISLVAAVLSGWMSSTGFLPLGIPLSIGIGVASSVFFLHYELIEDWVGDKKKEIVTQTVISGLLALSLAYATGYVIPQPMIVSTLAGLASFFYLRSANTNQ